MSSECLECVTPAITLEDDTLSYVSVTVDVAINGIDFTDAGVTFDMLNIHLTKCVPECCPREGGQKIIIHGTHLCEVDESILVKFLYEDGRSRIVPAELVPNTSNSSEGGENVSSDEDFMESHVQFLHLMGAKPELPVTSCQRMPVTRHGRLSTVTRHYYTSVYERRG